MTDNQSVIRSWIRGYSCDNGRSTLHTDGQDLFSYRLRIGYTDKRSNKIVSDYTAGSGNFKSKTTSRHVGSAKQQADKVEVPS